MTEQPVEPTYTLDQAKAELARLACEETGHQWDVVDVRSLIDPAGTPVAVQCTRCTTYHAVAAEPTAPPAAIDAPAE